MPLALAVLGQINSYGETNALFGGDDGAVDAHHLAIEVRQRAPLLPGLMAVSVWIKSSSALMPVRHWFPPQK
jgi:hypothetical protein